jgi:hypothetical protein
VCREGSMLWEMANSVAPGVRQYKWEEKLSIALKPLELASIATDPGRVYTFEHDRCKWGLLAKRRHGCHY